MSNTPTWLIVASILPFALVFTLSVVRRRRARGPGATAGEERLLFVGTSPLALALVNELELRSDPRWRVLGLVSAHASSEAADVGPWLGSATELPEIIAATEPTRIILARSARRRRIAEQVLLDARLSGIVVEDAADVLERMTGKMPIERLTPRSLLFSEGFNHSDLGPFDSTQRLARVFSAVTSAIGLVVSVPFLLLVALAIKLDSTGPVMFTQDRLGMGGRSFRLYKFRTMHEGSAGRRSEWVADNSHRITRVGRWLRRFRLDELPQLWNVLIGDMNLVGPRPHPSSNGPLFFARIPHYRLRASVRPGITGWAQIRYGYANGLDEETEKMRYDLYYIKHRTFGLDLRILVATLGLLLFDRQSHERVRHAPTAAPAWASRWPVHVSRG